MASYPYELYIFTRGAVVERYTNARRAVTYDAQTYAPRIISRRKWGKELSDAGVEFTIGSQNIPALGAIFQGTVIPTKVDVRDPVSGALLFSGVAQGPTWDGEKGVVTLPVTALSARADSELPNQIHSPLCSNLLGDPLTCAVDLTDPAFSVTAPVVDITFDGLTITCLLFANDGGGNSYPTNWWTWGTAEWGSGAGLEKVMISKHITETVMPGPVTRGVVTLMQPFFEETGANITLRAGCMRRKDEDCVAKFDNEANFRGFPHVSRYDVNKTKSG